MQKFDPAVMEEFLSCSLCFENFTLTSDNDLGENEGRDPMMLSCQHTYCKACLKELFSRRSKQISCPECRSVTNLADGSLHLKTNLAYIKFIGRSRESMIDVVNVPAKPMCSKHVSNELLFYCIPCRRESCIECFVENQCGHPAMKYSDAILQIKESLRESSMQIKTELRVSIAKCKERLSNYEQRRSTLVESFNEITHELLDLIHKKQSDLILQLDSQYEKDCRKIKAIKEETVHKLNGLKAAIKEALQNQDTEILQFSKDNFVEYRGVKAASMKSSFDKLLPEQIDIGSLEAFQSIEKSLDFIFCLSSYSRSTNTTSKSGTRGSKRRRRETTLEESHNSSGLEATVEASHGRRRRRAVE